jgi:thiol:disulfide interchange protein
VLLKLDVDTEEGKRLADRFDAQSLPTLVWIRPDGSEVHRSVGAPDAAGFREVTAEARSKA